MPETPYNFLREKKGAAAMKKEIAAIYCRLSVEDAETDAATEETVVAMMDADVSLMKKMYLLKGGKCYARK